MNNQSLKVFVALAAVLLFLYLQNNQQQEQPSPVGNTNSTTIVVDPQDFEPVENVYGAYVPNVFIQGAKGIQQQVYVDTNMMEQSIENDDDVDNFEESMVSVAFNELAFSPLDQDLVNRTRSLGSLFTSVISSMSLPTSEKRVNAVNILAGITKETERALSDVLKFSDNLPFDQLLREASNIILSDPLSTIESFVSSKAIVSNDAVNTNNVVNELLTDDEVLDMAIYTDDINQRMASKRGLKLSRSQQNSSENAVRSFLSKLKNKETVQGGQSKRGKRSSVFDIFNRINVDGKIALSFSLGGTIDNARSSRDYGMKRSFNLPLVYPVRRKDRSNKKRLGGKWFD